MATTRKSDAGSDQRALRRKEILDVAFDEFAAKGFAGASMEAIARHAQASKETLYAWFGNKEELFNTLLQSRIDGFTARYDPGVFGPRPAPEAVLEAIAVDVMRFMLAVEPLSRVLGAADDRVVKARRNAGHLITAQRKKFAALMSRWRSEGLIEFDDDPLEIVSLFIAMAQGEWSFRLATGMVDELTEDMITSHARRVTDIFLRGLAPLKKRR